MLHVLSFALFTAVFAISIGVIVTTIRADLDLILTALGVAPTPYAPLSPDGARRPARTFRVVRQARLAPTPQSVRAAA
jgi:hypothetical protein